MKAAFKESNLVRLIHELERTISELDQMDGMQTGGWAAGFSPSDSQAKLAIRRVMGHVKGRAPQPVKSTKDKDLWVDTLTEALWGVCKVRATEFSRGGSVGLSRCDRGLGEGSRCERWKRLSRLFEGVSRGGECPEVLIGFELPAL